MTECAHCGGQVFHHTDRFGAYAQCAQCGRLTDLQSDQSDVDQDILPLLRAPWAVPHPHIVNVTDVDYPQFGHYQIDLR